MALSLIIVIFVLFSLIALKKYIESKSLSSDHYNSDDNDVVSNVKTIFSNKTLNENEVFMIASQSEITEAIIKEYGIWNNLKSLEATLSNKINSLDNSLKLGLKEPLTEEYDKLLGQLDAVRENMVKLKLHVFDSEAPSYLKSAIKRIENAECIIYNGKNISSLNPFFNDISPIIRTQYPIPSFRINDILYLFFDSFIIVNNGNEILIKKYNEVQVSFNIITEDSYTLYPNSEVVQSHYLYQRINGEPDRRYTNNPLIYKIKFGELKIDGHCFKITDIASAQYFNESYNQLKRTANFTIALNKLALFYSLGDSLSTFNSGLFFPPNNIPATLANSNSYEYPSLVDYKQLNETLIVLMKEYPTLFSLDNFLTLINDTIGNQMNKVLKYTLKRMFKLGIIDKLYFSPEWNIRNRRLIQDFALKNNLDIRISMNIAKILIDVQIQPQKNNI